MSDAWTSCSGADRVIGFSFAVAKRYGEDHGGWLGSLIAYYGFFSLYPLLVVFVTVATWVFRDRPNALQAVLEALWSRLPFVTAEFSAEVEQQVGDLTGHGWVLALSLIVTMWGAVGVVRVLQDTVNTIWGVPRYRRPRFFAKLLRGLAVIGLLGLGVVGTAVVAGITLTVDLPLAAAFAAAAANIALAAGDCRRPLSPHASAHPCEPPMSFRAPSSPRRGRTGSRSSGAST